MTRQHQLMCCHYWRTGDCQNEINLYFVCLVVSKTKWCCILYAGLSWDFAPWTKPLDKHHATRYLFGVCLCLVLSCLVFVLSLSLSLSLSCLCLCICICLWLVPLLAFVLSLCSGLCTSPCPCPCPCPHLSWFVWFDSYSLSLDPNENPYWATFKEVRVRVRV